MKNNEVTVVAKNKKAYFDYEILEKTEAGIVLTGPEVKSVRDGRVQLKGSYVQVIAAKPVVVNLHISPYKSAPNEAYDPSHSRILLLKKKQIEELAAKLTQKGLTIVPLELYLKGNLIKVLIGVCKGRQQHDKRQLLKDRDVEREIQSKIKYR